MTASICWWMMMKESRDEDSVIVIIIELSKGCVIAVTNNIRSYYCNVSQ